MPPAVLWFRRDLRLGDNPALLAARDAGGTVLPLFVLDDALLGPAGAPRKAFLFRCLRELQDATGGALLVRAGQPEQEVPSVVREVGAGSVHVAADYGPYGAARDRRVEEALGAAGVSFERFGSPWAVAPGRVRKSDGSPYRVYTPYARAWREHGVRPPALRPRRVEWLCDGPGGVGVPPDPPLGGTRLPAAGESAGQAAWREFHQERLSAYAEARNTPGVPGTSELSVHLKYGTVHPRTLLADLGDTEGEQTFRGELAWRDFYADVLWHQPESAREALQEQMGRMRFDSGPEADARFAAWTDGRTGYPIVDAGMRQLLTEAWMHNRVRMIVASFLVKDLHLPWQRGARHFMAHLRDGELSSNAHGWQWVAGSGTDAAPYYRVFNPTTQGEKFDPQGDYVRRYVEELRGVAGKAVHQPWLLPGGPPGDYPAPIVDHAAERREALDRLAEVKR